MVSDLFRRMISAVLLALVAAGGGRLATVDALIFHEAIANPETFRSHFEASSACHDDGCSVRSVAYDTRLNPSIATPALSTVAPDDHVLPTPVSTPPQSFRSSHHLSRAPPLPV